MPCERRASPGVAVTEGRGSRRTGAPADTDSSITAGREKASADTASTERRPAKTTRTRPTDPASTDTSPTDTPPPDTPPSGTPPSDTAPAGWRAGLRSAEGHPPWAVVAAALGLALVCLVTVIALILTRPAVDDELRDSALVAARTYTTSLTTYDHRTLDEDVERVRRVATGEFATEYDATIEQLRQQLVTTQAVSTGTVVGAGIESVDPDSATVLVAVNQTIVSAEAPEPRSETNRLRMVLVRQDGSWRVGQVQRL